VQCYFSRAIFTDIFGYPLALRSFDDLYKSQQQIWLDELLLHSYTHCFI